MSVGGRDDPAEPGWGRHMRRVARAARAVATDPRSLPVMAAAVAAVVLWLWISPLAGPTNDTDAAASVLYFERLSSGRRLEAFVPTTAKPLLTVAYGVAWWLSHDWRSLSLLALLVGAASVGLAAALVRRAAGPAAAVFIAVALLAWPDFRTEVAHANSFVVALSLWLLAGLLVSAVKPRYRAAGLALLLAGLARPETVWVLVAAAVGIGTLAVRRRDSGRLRPGAAWPLLLGTLAFPLVSLHDWLLTGDPIYWLRVSAAYTRLVYPHLAAIGPRTFLLELWTRYEPALPVLCLAVVGIAALFLARRWALGLGLVAMTGGVAATLAVLALRATFVDERYYEELTAPILMAAAVGAGSLLDLGVGNVSAGGPRRSATAALAAPLVAGSLALLLTWPGTPGAIAATRLALWRDANLRLAPIVPALPARLARTAGRAQSVAMIDYPVADPRASLLVAPRALLPRLAVERGAAMTALGDAYLAFRDGGYADLRAGQWVLHIAAADGWGGSYAPFEVERSSPLPGGGAGLRVVPIVADPAAGVWLDRIEAGAPG